MPELSRFYGLVVQMYVRDHAPPHFHVAYGEHEAIVEIRRGVVVAGFLPLRARTMALEWALLHQAELIEAWELAVRGQLPGKIEPLA